MNWIPFDKNNAPEEKTWVVGLWKDGTIDLIRFIRHRNRIWTAVKRTGGLQSFHPLYYMLIPELPNVEHQSNGLESSNGSDSGKSGR